jgi:branched-chain amino acid transport system substrate-binding protein
LIFLFLLVTTFAGVGAAFLLQGAEAAKDAVSSSDEIRIGYTSPITGALASEGPGGLMAIKLALKQINEAGGVDGRKVHLLIEDTQSSNPGTLAALQKCVEQDKVVAIVGPMKSTQIFAISDAIKNYGIPTMIGGTNVNLTRKGNPWLFRCRPDDSIGAAAMVKYIKEDLKLAKVGILHDTDAYGTGGADLVEQALKESGLTLVKREKYTTKDKDFTAQLLSLKNAGAQVMVLYGTNWEDVKVIQRQYRQLGSPFKYIGSPSSDTREEAAIGLLLIVDYVPGESPTSKKYAEDYRKEYGKEFFAVSAWAYDALNILVNAIREAGEDPSKIREALLATKGYKGVLGTFAFTPNGDGLSQVSVVQIQEGGKHKLLKVVNVGKP